MYLTTTFGNTHTYTQYQCPLCCYCFCYLVVYLLFCCILSTQFPAIIGTI